MRETRRRFLRHNKGSSPAADILFVFGARTRSGERGGAGMLMLRRPSNHKTTKSKIGL